MKEMGTKNRKGRRSLKIAALAVVLAVLLAGVSLFSAAAASLNPPSGQFQVQMPEPVNTTLVPKEPDPTGRTPQYTIHDSKSKLSTAQQVSLNGLFDVQSASSVKKITILMEGVYSGGPIQASVDKSGSQLNVSTSGRNTSITAASLFGFTAADIRNLLGYVTLSFNENAGERNSHASITLKAYNRYSTGAVSDKDNLIQWTSYTSEIDYYTFAQGKLDAGTLQVGYTSDSKDQSVVNPADAENGVATFEVNVTDQGGGNDVQLGYKIKTAKETWTDNPIQGLTEVFPTGSEALSKPIPIKVTGFAANTEYDVKAVVITDGKDDAVKETESVRFQYMKPTVNSFNIGDTSAAYTGGEVKNVSTAVAFPNYNYDGKEHDGVMGPQLQLQLFFTPALTSEEEMREDPENEGGFIPTGRYLDTSVWTQVGDTQSFNLANSVSRMVNYEFKHTLPKDVDGAGCAYKLVVTDPIADYSVYQFSDSFLLDSFDPEAPTVRSRSVSGDETLSNGTSLAGGENAKVTLDIGGSNDSASGIKGYDYSMYYLGTEQGDAFAKSFGKEVTMQSILLTMKEKLTSKDAYPDVEFTDWTSLPEPNSENLTSLSVSKDGYYCVHTRAVDKVGKTSDETISLFRVDLTAPNPPQVRLAQPATGKTPAISGGAVTADMFEAYDGRTYSNNDVWLFAKSIPLTGKSINTGAYQYSLDGGLTWKKVAEENQYVSKAGTLNNMFKADYSGKENFDYDVGFKLSSAEVQGYQSIIVRAVDTLGNSSLASEAVVMRQSESITVTGSLSHENVEVALALGNTEMENTETLAPRLKNAAAKKINERYFGKVVEANITHDETNSKFNPLYLLYTKVNEKWVLHQCTWDNGGNTCDQGNECPYKKYGEKYKYYTPDMVNVQGVKSTNANNTSEFDWVRYDHTMYQEFATAAYLGKEGVTTKSMTTPKPTTLEGNRTYYDRNSGLYTASQDRVIDMGQKSEARAVMDATGKSQLRDENGNLVWDWTSSDTNNDLDTFAQQYAMAYDAGSAKDHPTNPGSGNTFRWSANGGYGGDYETNTLAGKKPTYVWASGTQIRRVYHVMDISYPETVSGNFKTYDVEQGTQNPMSKIGNAGYYRGAYRDWLFLYNDQPTKKTIYFTADDKTLVTHASDGYGFLFNTTIRQSKAGIEEKDKDGKVISTSDGSWRISGYLFYIGCPYVDRGTYKRSGYTFDHTENPSGFRWYILKLDDVNMEHFADGTIRGSAGDKTSGYGHSEAKLGTNRLLDACVWGTATSPDGVFCEQYNGFFGQQSGKAYHDDLTKYLMYGGDKTEGLNGNYWISTDEPGSTKGIQDWTKATGINYGIEQIAMYESPEIKADKNNRFVRNFVIITEGTTTKVYVYRNGTGGNVLSLSALQEKFKTDVTKENPVGAEDFSKGYRLIEWQDIRDDVKVFDEVENEDGTVSKTLNRGLINTPRPEVDGYQIGKEEAAADGVHDDTNCYGFGPLYGVRGYSHACFADTRVELSNISMEINVARKLTEVITEPKWGGGKAKYILNISDDSVKDFNDPVLASQVEWRISTDQARLIGWGSSRNQAITKNFIDNNIEGRGMYQATADAQQEQELEKIADYIAQTYYEEFGLKADGNVTDQVQTMVENKGAVYTLDDIQKIDFKVTPEEYNDSTANADYPSGRWYIVHDTLGYPNAIKSSRDHQYSDALNLQITEPGRYSVYFAPDPAAVGNGLLDPEDKSCVFDFVVNQPPKAQLVGTVDKTTQKITVQDFSIDPDTPNGTVYKDPDSATPNQQVTGIDQTQWRWELRVPYMDPITQKESVVIAMSQEAWETSPMPRPDGKDGPYDDLTVEQLTKLEGKLTADGKAKIIDASEADKVASGMKKYMPKVSGSTYYYDAIPDGAVIMVYEKVRDVSTVKRLNPGKTAYEYRVAGNAVSEPTRQSLVSGTSAVVVAPASAVNISEVNVYDTADPNETILVTRKSFHTQAKDLTVGFQIDLNDGKGYQDLTSSDEGHTWKLDSETVLSVYEDSDGKTYPPACDSKGQASGTWTMTKQFIRDKTNGIPDREIALRIVEKVTETIPKEPLQEGEEDPTVKDVSARTIYFRRDSQAPSAQTVDVKTQITLDGGKNWNEQDYEASNYLDVTQNDKKIVIRVGGASDSQGKLAGYGYYFYDYDTNNNVTKIYKLNHDASEEHYGELVEVTEGTIEERMKKAVGWNPATKTGDCVLGPEGGEIEITGAAQRTEPTDSLNIAIFAFDNQHFTDAADLKKLAKDNLTLANETPRTKIEKIKLASFTPMPAEINVMNALGERVAHVGNDGGFVNDKGEAPGDTQDKKVNTNSNVTIQFTPKQGWFTVEDGKDPVYDVKPPADAEENVEYQKTHSKYYMDISKQADLTNKAMIQYTIEMQDNNGQYQVYTYQGITHQDLVIEATNQITISESGRFRVKAKVQNGSKAYSDERTVEFEIDKTAPTGMKVEFLDVQSGKEYQKDTWAKEVTMTVSGATDAENPVGAHYRYTMDNGASWHDGGDKLATVTKTFNKTGEYNIRVFAVDQAGNESETQTMRVRIDAEAPVMSPPSLTVSEDSVLMYNEYVITILNSQGGKVQAWNGNTADEMNTEITVPLHGNQQFLITPDEGKEVQSVVCGNRTYAPGELTARGDGSYVLLVENVVDNAQLSVNFVDSGTAPQGYMAAARSSFKSYLREAAEKDTGIPAPIDMVTHLVEGSADLNGVISPELEYVEDGGSVKFTFTPYPGNQLDTVTVTRGSDPAETVQPTPSGIPDVYEYTVENITTNVTVEASFKVKQSYTLGLKWNADSGAVTLAGGQMIQEGNGSSQHTFFDQEALTLNFAPLEGYAVTDVTINGTSLGGVAGDALSIPPQYTSGNMEIQVKFGVAGSEKVTILLDPVGEGGRVEPLGEPQSDGTTLVELPTGSSKTFYLYPEPGFTPSVEWYRYDMKEDTWKLQKSTSPVPQGDGSYTYTQEAVGDSLNKLVFSFSQRVWKIQTSVTSKTAAGEVSNVSGGSLTVTRSDGVTENLNAVPENVQVTFDIQPNTGWRIQEVNVNGQAYGNRRSFTIPSVNKDYTVDVVFVERAFDSMESVHTLSVMANNISDNQQSLHPTQTYRFKLSDGAGETVENWSSWQASPSYTYTNLEPNHEYQVTVQAQDAAGNASTQESVANNSKTIYTLANYPSALSLDTMDDENVTNKTAVLTVDPNGNPKETRYKVFLSNKKDMTGREAADVGTPDGWVELNGSNEIMIYHLVPGKRYYMQVVAENQEDIATEANDKNVVDILLSPIAPPENSFYFEEQSAPGKGITLHWDSVGEGDIQGFEIYRDGALIASCAADETTYTDNSNIWGDSLYVYSYAYVNSAGTGSRRSAVSEQYYNAVPEERLKLDQLAEDLNTTADAPYNETMTYPIYPNGIRKEEATALTEDENSGRAYYYITTGVSAASRNQKYEVGLQAYEKDAEGNYTPVSGWDWHDHLVTTKTIDSRGALAKWDNLNINYEYRIFVNKVMSTGPRMTSGSSVLDGYDGSTGGLEGAFGKKCTVTSEGYAYTFTNESAKALLAHPETVIPWGTGQGDGYAAPGGWSQPIGEYIKFNKSPQIKLAADPLASNTNGESVDYQGQKALMLDTSSGDMSFKVDVNVWDPDGAENKDAPSFKITGTLNGQTGSVAGAVTSVATDEAHAETYSIVFDASNLPTGIYQDVTISVSDGGTKRSESVTVPVIVNRTLPTIKIKDSGVVKQIELDKDYGTTSTYEITTSVGAANCGEEQMRAIRLNAMGAQYTALFGSNEEQAIQANLNGNVAPARESAKKVLGEDTYNTYMADGKFDETETAQLIDTVSPPLQGWFTITQGEYDAAVAAGHEADVYRDSIGGTSRYWATTEYAFANKLCEFLIRDADTGHIKVRGTPNKQYTVRLTTEFGGNMSSSLATFRVRNKLNVSVQTSKRWAWKDANHEEFLAYKTKNKTVEQIAQDYVLSYQVKPWEQEPDDPTFAKNAVTYWPEDATGDPEIDGSSAKYKVFKLIDEKVTVGSTYMSATLDVATGIYPHISDVYALLTKDPDYVPKGPEDELEAESKRQITSASGATNLTSRDNGEASQYGIPIYLLEPDTTYYLWVGYTIADPETGEETREYVQNYTAITTDGDYHTASYGFETVSDSRKETIDVNGTGAVLNYPVRRSGDAQPKGVFNAEIRYYQADQYGEMLTDENGLPIELTGEQLAAAQKTLTISTPTLTFDSGGTDYSKQLQLRLYNTEDVQGHMMAKVTLSVDEELSTGYNTFTQNGQELSIFVLDDDSPITTYVAGLDEVEGLKPREKESNQKPGKYFEYQFRGISDLQLTPESLSLALKNEGQGVLSNISVQLYNQDQTTPSSYFDFTQSLTKDSLVANMDEISATDRAYFGISAKTDLQDGVYDGWIKIAWDNMEDEDTLWVHLNQVAYQSTLKGYVYFGADKPTAASTAFIGKSTVKIYEKPQRNGAPLTNLLYSTETNDEGYYEIPNILNGDAKYRYCIVIERPGFLTFNPWGNNEYWDRKGDTGVFELSVRLIGGDANGDEKVTMDDYNLLGTYYNKTYDPQNPKEEDLPLMRCDYNADGVVNALDRMLIWGNQGKTGSVYFGQKPSEIQ